MDEVGVDAARWYLVNRGPDQTIEIDVDLAAERSEKNPVYYVQYAHARIAGILRNAGDARDAAAAARRRSRREERDLIKRLADFPGVAAEAAERRGAAGDPELRDPASPTISTASTTSTACSDAHEQAFRLALCRATQSGASRAASTWSASTRPSGCSALEPVRRSLSRPRGA